MKAVKLFYQERCPFCKKALRYIEELNEAGIFKNEMEALLRKVIE